MFTSGKVLWLCDIREGFQGFYSLFHGQFHSVVQAVCRQKPTRKQILVGGRWSTRHRLCGVGPWWQVEVEVEQSVWRRGGQGESISPWAWPDGSEHPSKRKKPECGKARLMLVGMIIPPIFRTESERLASIRLHHSHRSSCSKYLSWPLLVLLSLCWGLLSPASALVFL